MSLSSINFFGIATATICFSEAFTTNHFISFIIAIIGILFISLKTTQQKTVFNFQSILLPLLAAMFWGVGYTLFKIPLQWMGALTLSLLIESTVLIVSFVMLLQSKTVVQLNFKKAFSIPQFYVAGLLLVSGSVLINIALTKLSIATVNILGLFTFPVSIFSAYLFSKEKPTKKEGVGIILIVASIIFLIIVK